MLREIICGQITLESKGLSVDQAAIKMEALYLYIEEKRWNIVKKAIDLSTKKSATFQQKEEFVVKNGECDAGLTHRHELEKVMLDCLDRFNVERQSRSKSL